MADAVEDDYIPPTPAGFGVGTERSPELRHAAPEQSTRWPMPRRRQAGSARRWRKKR
jgi:hypothetical protein